MDKLKDSDRKKNRLFQTSQKYIGNVVLNFLGSASKEFPYYANKYRDAAHYLTEKMAAKSGFHDLEACPIVFLYRHALELYFKGIIINGIWLESLSKREPVNYPKVINSHNLSCLLPHVKSAIISVGWKWPIKIENNNETNTLDDLVKEIESVDNHSFSFRYPTNKSLEPTLEKHFSFNIFIFAGKMQAICDLLSGACYGLEDCINTQCELLD